MDPRYGFALLLVILVVLIWYCWPRPPTLYDQLGGVYAIAAVVDHFSDALIQNPIVGKDSKNPYLRDWHRNHLDRLAGLKWMRTLWVCAVTGGPYKFIPTTSNACPFSLEGAHARFAISPEEFDAVAQQLKASLDHFQVPAELQTQVLGAFAAHKSEINQGYFLARGLPVAPVKCPFA